MTEPALNTYKPINLTKAKPQKVVGERYTIFRDQIPADQKISLGAEIMLSSGTYKIVNLAGDAIEATYVSEATVYGPTGDVRV